jgi:hypothetical protein
MSEKKKARISVRKARINVSGLSGLSETSVALFVACHVRFVSTKSTKSIRFDGRTEAD